MSVPEIGRLVRFHCKIWEECPINDHIAKVIEIEHTDIPGFPEGTAVCLEFLEDYRKTWCATDECLSVYDYDI